MKFSCEVEISRSRDKVIELFDKPENLLKWMPDLIRFEQVSGVPGQANAKSRLVFRAGRGELEMMETITERRLPDEISGLYQTKMGVTKIRNRFLEQGDRTRWIVDTEFEGSGLMKFVAPLMGGAMRGQTQKVVQSFKRFAESQDS